jgi:hypothetical protein
VEIGKRYPEGHGEYDVIPVERVRNLRASSTPRSALA